jgi:hypothetical protein
MQMKPFWQSMSIVAAACFVLAACGSMARAQSGFLLGLHRGCGEEGCATEYRSLWIAPQDGKLQILELPDLIVPRKTGFWRVGTRFYCDPDELKNDPQREPSPDGAFFATPVNQRPVVYGLAQCPAHVQHLDTQEETLDNAAYGATGIDVTFVNDEYISLDDWGRTDCCVHPDASHQSSVARLGDPARNPIAYSEIEGVLARSNYEWAAAEALLKNANLIDNDDRPKMSSGEGNAEDETNILENFPKWSNMSELDKVTVMQTLDDGCFPKHDDREWHIVRDHGQWRAYGSFDTHRLCGVEVNFELPFHASFAAPATAPISLDAIGKRIPGAYDAFWSPGRETVVVLIDPDHPSLEVFSPRGQDMGKPVITMQLKEFEGPAMAEWATGSNVTRWTAELKRIKAQGVVKPVLSLSPYP